MNLKEAFRFQNKLGNLMDQTQEILEQDANLLKVENTYLRRKVMHDAENETIQELPPSEYAGRITDVVKFMMFLLTEKEKLAQAIHNAKALLPIDMDSETGLNSTRQQIARIFRQMCDLRSSEKVLVNGGTGYCFNQEGNQVSYRCDVRRVATINFDRKVPRNFMAELNRKADAVSNQLDRCLITAEVAYQQPFDVNDSFAEIFLAFAENQEQQ